MSNKINIRDVQLEWLDSACLVKISKYTKLRFDEDQVVMDIRDKYILQRVFDHARETDNEQLKAVYQELKAAIKTCLADDSIANEVSSSTVPDYLVADKDNSRVSRDVIVKRWFKARNSTVE